MSTPWQEFDARIVGWLAAEPSRIPFITGGCFSGRSAMLGRVLGKLGHSACHLVDISRITSTPERFTTSLVAHSPFGNGEVPIASDGPRDAYAKALAHLDLADAHGAPATFLLDEILDLRVFESFPGLKTVVQGTFARLVSSRNHFVLTTRFTFRALRLARDLPDRFLVLPVPPLQPEDVAADLERIPGLVAGMVDEYARIVIALTDGRYGYARELVDHLVSERAGAPDPVSALARLLAPGGTLAQRCAYSYELRLNRTRGYGTLRAILAILAEEEPLTLTEIAHELSRTPGSTKDYLSWLEEVDLVAAHHRRYTLTDPLLRVWVRLNSGTAPPTDDRLVADVQRHALGRLS